jgi:hypothetical protein
MVLYDAAHYLFTDQICTDRMFEAGVMSASVHDIRKSKLSQTAQALKLGRIDDRNRKGA